MANCKALIVTAMLLCLSFVRSQGDVGSVAPSSPEQEQEIQMLRAKVASLVLIPVHRFALQGKNYLICFCLYWVEELRYSFALEDEINRRNEETLELESAVRERTAQTAALIAELDVLQVIRLICSHLLEKCTLTNDEYCPTRRICKQIQRLGSDLEDQVKKGESLEVRATEAEKSWQELNRKLKRVKKTDAEQKKKIRELDGKLQQVQAKLAELEKEAKMKDEELAKVHGMWLPHWLAVHAVRCQELASAKWQVHGKPMFDPLMQKAAQSLHTGALQVQKGVKHLMEDNEVLKPLSDDRLTWFTVSSLVDVCWSITDLPRLTGTGTSPGLIAGIRAVHVDDVLHLHDPLSRFLVTGAGEAAE
ncbi:hypothetical protein PR202_ga19119 [Eleusine coracana subsp. coracana]|uniref:Uncharacterized protein n=1 Tax=Eleusine coracana subsp. coracana TaxID=191504 RepID=A0AAV5CUP7_ELECO|nr:hypothetical protein PR202_ga19119 [Eleusine coracana subsp. coracana]